MDNFENVTFGDIKTGDVVRSFRNEMIYEEQVFGVLPKNDNYILLVFIDGWRRELSSCPVQRKV